jgi:hypothetical protein
MKDAGARLTQGLLKTKIIRYVSQVPLKLLDRFPLHSRHLVELVAGLAGARIYTTTDGQVLMPR